MVLWRGGGCCGVVVVSGAVLACELEWGGCERLVVEWLSVDDDAEFDGRMVMWMVVILLGLDDSG